MYSRYNIRKLVGRKTGVGFGVGFGLGFGPSFGLVDVSCRQVGELKLRYSVEKPPTRFYTKNEGNTLSKICLVEIP